VPEGGVSGTLPVPDYQQLFDVAPVPLLALTPDFRIVRANRARLESTGTTQADTVGRHLFEVLSANPDDAGADGPSCLERSLLRARSTGRPDVVPVQRYDIPLPDGGFARRFWSFHTVPVLDARGDVVLLLHRADDVTDYVRYRDRGRWDRFRGPAWAERVRQAEAELRSRTEELERINAQLQAAHERERRTAQTAAALATPGRPVVESRDDLLRRMFRHGRRAGSFTGRART